VIAIFVQQKLIKDEPPPGTSRFKIIRHVRLLNRDLRNMLVSDIIIRFCEQIPDMLVVMWVVELNHISEINFGSSPPSNDHRRVVLHPRCLPG
jgi:hypothetical protein